MSDEIKKYLENLGFDYSDSKSKSGLSRKELINEIAKHPIAGKKFDRKSFNIEEDMKKNGIYYKC
jgi:retron-type reverse transcriptase